MKSLFLAAALGLGSLGLVGLTPVNANASWLSEALRRRYDPGYYAGYDTCYAPPTYDYGYYPTYGYVAPPPVYYSAPYYQPGVSFYWSDGPRYYGNRYGYRGGWHGEPHGERHGGHGGGHRR